MAQFDEMMAITGGLNPLEAPIPGESLTANPETPAPYEKPPEHTDLNKAMEDLFIRLSEGEALEQILNLMRADINVEEIAQVVLFGGFREGKFNPDLMLLMIEPTIYLLLWFAEYAGIDAKLGSDDDLGMEFEEEGFDVTEAPAPEGISTDLLSKIKAKAGE